MLGHHNADGFQLKASECHSINYRTPSTLPLALCNDCKVKLSPLCATGEGKDTVTAQNATKNKSAPRTTPPQHRPEAAGTRSKGLTANSLSGSFSPFLRGREWMNCCTSLAL